MIVYYADMAWRGCKRHPVLSIFIVMAIALGVSAPLSVITLVQRLGSDPLPGRSDKLYHPQLEPRPISAIKRNSDLPDDLTLHDARLLYRIKGAPVGAIMSSNRLPAKRADADADLSMTPTRATTHEFFALFGLRFIAGRAWDTAEDSGRARVVVLSRKANQRLFGELDSIGREVVIATQLFQVVGVVDDWNPKPHFYDLNGGAFANAEDMYIPFETWLDLPQDYGYGPARCWPIAGAGRGPTATNCTWVQYWVRLPTLAEAKSYHALLDGYAKDQHEAGRFQASIVALRSLSEWIEYKQIVPTLVRMQLVIGLGIFIVCMVTAIGLLVAKFSRYGRELLLRRALGASRLALFMQCLVDAGLAGTAGGVLALPMTLLGFRLIRQQVPAMHEGIGMLPSSMWEILAISLTSTLLIGCIPALRCANISPASQVKP